MLDHIRNSNLIEGVNDPQVDMQSLAAWRFLDRKPQLTEEIVLYVHQRIMDGLLPSDKIGTYRHDWVRVGKRLCPDPIQVPMLMRDWLRKMQSSWKHDAISMHVEFEHIHPFVDGNGQVGRMLFWWHQIQNGVLPTLIKYGERFDYYSWFDPS